MFGRAVITSLFLSALVPTVTAGDIAVLYDPDLVSGITQTPDEKEQGFGKLSSDIFNQSGFFTAGDGVTEFDTTADPELFAVFGTHSVFDGEQAHPRAQVLDREVGFRVSFDFAIRSEQHDPFEWDGDGVCDQSGFTVSVIGSDLKGIAFGFWEDRIWVLEDDAEDKNKLLAQAEFLEQPAAEFAKLRRYDIEVKGDGYRIRIDGVTKLTGRLRDYSNFPGAEIPIAGNINSFDKPNAIILGDAIDNGMSRVGIGDITSETPYDPPPEPRPEIEIELTEVGQPKLRWDAIPGVLYSIQSSCDLSSFTEFEDFIARRFSEEYTDPRENPVRQYYRIVPLGATP